MESSSSEEKPSTPKLALFPIKRVMGSPEHPGTLTPPHRTSLSVPFRWEEEPGKPLPCLALATVLSNDTTPKSLELPPRLLFSDTKLPSPTTVLDGPYAAAGGRQRFQSSSFRAERKVSFSPERGTSSSSATGGGGGALVVSRRRGGGFKGKGWFGSWSRRVLLKGSGGNNKEVSGGSYVFPSSGERESDDGSVVKVTRIRRAGSFSTLARPTSHFWGTIYEGLKQAVPWRSKKWNRVI